MTTLITNHTFSNLVLRPPSLASDPLPVDEPMYKALGDAMAAENGYLSQPSYELYDTSGGTEDWSYYATGGLGFTFEICCNHIPDSARRALQRQLPPDLPEGDQRVRGDLGPTPTNPVSGGNREAYFIAMEHAADAANHSLIEGSAPPGAILKIEKDFVTPTRNEDQPSFEDHLESELEVPELGQLPVAHQPLDAAARRPVPRSRGTRAAERAGDGDS